MNHNRWKWPVIGTIVIGLSTWQSVTCQAQYGGSQAGVNQDPVNITTIPALERDVVEGYLSLDGIAEIRVKPTAVRMVLAVTSEGETAIECQTKIAGTLQALRTSWSNAGIPSTAVVEDFIALLPTYEWKLETRGDSEVGVERKSGYRMQTNLHLSLKNDESVRTAVEVALLQGVTDLIAFDYWAPGLDQIKQDARQQAVRAAKAKADALFSELFSEPPSVINLQEETKVYFPSNLYRSFTNAYEESVTTPWRRDLPFIRATRARNTYYQGLNFDGDVQSNALKMEPEISVVSTVRLYFAPPGKAPVSN